jgi:hypothetical protein
MHCQETTTCHSFLPRLRRHWLPHVSRALTAKHIAFPMLTESRASCPPPARFGRKVRHVACRHPWAIGRVSDGIMDPWSSLTTSPDFIFFRINDPPWTFHGVHVVPSHYVCSPLSKMGACQLPDYIIWSLLDVSLPCQSVMQNLHHPPHRNVFILYWTHGPVHTCAFRSPTVRLMS